MAKATRGQRILLIGMLTIAIMVALAFGERYPQRVERLFVISAADQPHPMATAWRSVQRNIARLGLAQDRPGFLGSDVASGGDIDAVADKGCLVRGQQVVAGQGGDRFDRSAAVASMVARLRRHRGPAVGPVGHRRTDHRRR